MKRTILACVAIVLLLASLDASAIEVEARGFTLCTSINAATLVCTAGTFWQRGDELEEAEVGENPDWSPTYTDRWEPHGITSFDDSMGINWTCCMDYDSETEDPATFTYAFQYWNVVSNAWADATWKGFIGYDDDLGKWCADTDADYVFQGKQNTSTGGVPWDYGTSPDDRVARCKGQIINSETGASVWRAIEYWME